MDLRDLKGARSVLFGDLGLDPAAPTLLFAECVLNYMTKAQADRLIRWIPANFAEAALFSYDQARPWDAFGKMLCGNLGKKGAGLKGIDAAASPATQLARWRRLAWTGGGSVLPLASFRITDLHAGCSDRRTWRVITSTRAGLHTMSPPASALRPACLPVALFAYSLADADL